MATNRVLVFLHGDAESSAYSRAKRRQAKIVNLLESLEQAASVPRACIGVDEHSDDQPAIEFFFPTVDDLLTKPEDELHLQWCVCDDDACIPLAKLAELPAVLVAQIREFAGRLMQAADQVEAMSEGGAK